MYKVEAVVMSNKRECLVLDKDPVIKYERYGNHLLGLDEYGIFCNCYYHQRPSGSWEAFAGRKFDIPMADGTIEKAYGQWWSGGEGFFTETLGARVVDCATSTIKEMKECYLLYSFRAVAEEWQKLRDTYSGKVWGYWEFDGHLKGRAPIKDDALI